MWPQVDLQSIKSDVKGSLVSGPFGSNIGSRFFVDEGVPVIRGNNLTLGREKFLDKGFVFVTESKASELKNCIAIGGDLVFTAAGTLGQLGLIPKDAKFKKYVISNKQIRLRLDVGRCFPLFAYYYLSSSAMRAFIASQNKGSSVPLLTLGIIRKVPIHLPPLRVQVSIAAVLSAYDDLIENNRRRIALLERMAEQLYREWFVRFRFPGFEHVKFKHSVPVHWKYESLDDLCKVIKRGISPAYDDDAITRVINQRCIRDGDVDLFLARGHVTKVPMQKYVVFGDILVNSTGVGTLGRIGLVDQEMQGVTSDSHVTICRADPEAIESIYLGYAVKSLQSYFESMASGSTGQKELGRSTIANTQILVPPRDLQQEFARIVADLQKQRRYFKNAISSLSRSRDLLLPRLISGKLRVDDLDIQFPPSMQTEHA